jgi:hypothetical protein
MVIMWFTSYLWMTNHQIGDEFMRRQKGCAEVNYEDRGNAHRMLDGADSSYCRFLVFFKAEFSHFQFAVPRKYRLL